MQLWIRRFLLASGVLLAGGIALDFGLERLLAHPLPLEHLNVRTNPMLGGVLSSYDDAGFRKGTGLPAEHSVLFVGDSFTLGFGVEDSQTFPRQTEEALRRQGASFSSWNAGGVGWGGAHELRILRQALTMRSFDMLVIQVLPHNDLDDNWIDGSFQVEGGRLVEGERAMPVRMRLGAVVRNLPGLSSYAKGLTSYDPATDDGFALERLLVGAMVELAKQKGMTPLVVVMPTRRELKEADSVAIARYERTLAELRTLPVSVMDLRETVHEPEDFLPADGHLSPLGNTRVGEAIAKAVLATSKH